MRDFALHPVHTNVSCTKVYVWEPKMKKGPFGILQKVNPKDYGHVAIELDADDSYWSKYISAVPDRLTEEEAKELGIPLDSDRIWKGRPIKFIESYEQEKENRKRDAKHVRKITWLNTDAMKDFFDTANWENVKYNLVDNNCSSCCRQLLRLGVWTSKAAEELPMTPETIFDELAGRYLANHPGKLLQYGSLATKFKAINTLKNKQKGDDPYISPSDILLVSNILRFYQTYPNS